LTRGNSDDRGGHESSHRSPLRCDAVVFDLDGVLVDSAAVVERHWRTWAAGRGVPFERIAAIHHGRPTVDTVRLVAPQLDAASEARQIEAGEADDTDGLVIIDGASRLLSGLPAQRWAIVTSGTRRTALARLAHAGLAVPDVLITADDVARGKPAPDPYLLAAERLGVAPSRCVVVEDAPAGVASARAAGALVIAVASTTSPAALSDAHVVLDRLDGLDIEVQPEGLTIAWPQTA